MLYKTQGIVLQNIKYADKKNISKIYTRELGIISVNAFVGSASKNKIAPSLIQPLSQIEIEISFKENTELHSLKEAKVFYQYQTIHSDFYKICIAQFMNEILLKCLKEQTKNSDLFDFITSLLQWLDKTSSGFNNIHVYFLFNFCKYLGFYPFNNYNIQNQYFNLTEGKFQEYKLEFPLGLDQHQSFIFKELFDYDLNSDLVITKMSRDTLIEILMMYYKYHFPGFKDLKSYYVLKETLNN